MRKLYILLLSNLCLPFCFTVNAQFASNSSFEDWNFETYYEDPTGFNSLNLESYSFFGEGNVLRSEDSFAGMYAAHLMTKDTEEGALPGFLILGDVDDDINSGIPYSSVPQSLNMQLKYDIPVNDTAWVVLALLNNGVNIGGATGTITGSSASLYVPYSLDVEFYDLIVPDEMVFVMTSGSFDNPLPGGEIMVDDISFEYNVSGEDFPNGGFEDWTPTGAEEPEHWFTSNFLTSLGGGLSVTKTDDAYYGDYAVRIETQAFGFSEGEDPEYSSFITNGPIGSDGPVAIETIDDSPAAITGFYKYSPIEPEDLGTCYFLLVTDDGIGTDPDTVVELQFSFVESSSYANFSFNLPYDDIMDVWPSTPVNMFIGFSSTRITDTTYTPLVGSVLYLDNLALEYIISVDDISSGNFNSKIIPNPVHDHFIIETEMENVKAYKIFGVDGRLIEHKERLNMGEPLRVNTDKIDAGMFIVQLISDKGIDIIRGLKE